MFNGGRQARQHHATQQPDAPQPQRQEGEWLLALHIELSLIIIYPVKCFIR